MSKKPLTIEERVDILLKTGVEHPKKWMAVHGYVEPSNYDKFDQDGHFNEVHFDVLRDHHLEETKFLFEIVGELVKRLNKCPQCAMNTLIPSEGCLLCPTCGYSKG